MFVRSAAVFACVGALWLSFATAEVAAQGLGAGAKMRALPKGARVQPEDVLSRDELRQCVADEGRLDKQGGEIIKLGALNTAERARIDALGAELDSIQSKIDRTSKAEVDAFNSLIATHKEWVAAFNAQLPEYNRKVEGGKAVIARFNAVCAKKPYYERDMEAVKAGL